jgi:hypothetical protein
VGSLTGELMGTGSVTLMGTAQVIDAALAGTGTLAAGDLPAGDATVTVSGSGDTGARATRILNATLSGTGEIA